MHFDTAYHFLFFFFQAEDGIRDADVTGVQTCALPISFVCSSRIRAGLGEKQRPRWQPMQTAASFSTGSMVQHIGCTPSSWAFHRMESRRPNRLSFSPVLERWTCSLF